MIYIIRLHNADCKPIIPLSANPTKWSNTLRQLVGNLPTNCLSVFDHFVKLVLKGLTKDSLLKFHKSDIRSKIGLKKISLRRTRAKKGKLIKILRIWMFGIVWYEFHPRTCTFQLARNVSFSENSAQGLIGWSFDKVLN